MQRATRRTALKVPFGASPLWIGWRTRRRYGSRPTVAHHLEPMRQASGEAGQEPRTSGDPEDLAEFVGSVIQAGWQVAWCSFDPLEHAAEQV